MGYVIYDDYNGEILTVELFKEKLIVNTSGYEMVDDDWTAEEFYDYIKRQNELGRVIVGEFN